MRMQWASARPPYTVLHRVNDGTHPMSAQWEEPETPCKVGHNVQAARLTMMSKQQKAPHVRVCVHRLRVVSNTGGSR